MSKELVDDILFLLPYLRDMLHKPLRPKGDNFTPSERTPWGGTKIVESMKPYLPSNRIVGESWELSAHPSFPNHFEVDYQGSTYTLPITVFEGLDNEALYGTCGSLPFLVKFLNSGSWIPARTQLPKIYPAHTLHRYLLEQQDTALRELHREMIKSNLSIQVHPGQQHRGYGPSKAEIWFILEAEEGAGIYLGLKDGVTREDFSAVGVDFSELLNFIPVYPGDVYSVPPGTMHAVGAGILLLEVQETSESTYRVYDWDRLDANGKRRPLHIKECKELCDWDAPRGENVREHLYCKNKFFVFERFVVQLFEGNNLQLPGGIVQGLVVLEGSLKVEGYEVKKGQSLLFPAACKEMTIHGEGANFVLLHARSGPKIA